MRRFGPSRFDDQFQRFPGPDDIELKPLSRRGLADDLTELAHTGDRLAVDCGDDVGLL